MSKNGDLNSTLVAIGLIGVGIAGFAALNASEQRRKFRDALRNALAHQGVGFVSAELGTAVDGRPVWYVVVNHPWVGLQQYHALFAMDAQPYSAATLDDLIARLVRALPPSGAFGRNTA